MGQNTRAGGSRYLTPIKQSDASSPDEKGRGKYTLAANTTYVYIIGGAAAPFLHVHLTGYTAGLVITSATIQTASHQDLEVTDVSTTVGEWIPETPASGDVQKVGTGWSSSAAVVAASGAGVGGASWHLAEWPPARTMLIVAVGATGGDVRVSCHGKS